IVCQFDGVGRRTVTLVELAWATAPGDPNAEEAEQGSLLCELMRFGRKLTSLNISKAPGAAIPGASPMLGLRATT
ncbi:hypothetical protein, partial [Mesorhizobium sp.]|uniref:hypothetical protein n=1 Tax=Mesorhizobium sp. TaxID=1871066 RepID=UPI0025E646C7